MTAYPFTHEHTVPDAGWPETDLADSPALDLAAHALQIALAQPDSDPGSVLRIAALAEISQEINHRNGTPAGPTLPTSARGSLAQYVAHTSEAGPPPPDRTRVASSVRGGTLHSPGARRRAAP